jgi:hypothetical protein
MRTSWSTFIGAGLLLGIFVSLPLYAWFMDKGLEGHLEEMKALFRKRELFRIYTGYVDSRLKVRIGKAIDRMKADRAHSTLIAHKLGFGRHQDFLSASHDDIVRRYFMLMVNPPGRKGRSINNADYLRLALLLSLLFAHLDTGMKIIEKNISGTSARIIYSGNGLRIVTYYVYRNKRWCISNREVIDSR